MKGSLDGVKLIHADGSYVDCLLNMYFDNRGFIICKFQAMSLADMTMYNEYSAKLDQDWFLNSPSEFEAQSGLNESTYDDLDEDLDESSTTRSATSKSKKRFSMEEQININVGLKRKHHSLDLSSSGDELSIEIDTKHQSSLEDFSHLDT